MASTPQQQPTRQLRSGDDDLSLAALARLNTPQGAAAKARKRKGTIHFDDHVMSRIIGSLRNYRDIDSMAQVSHRTLRMVYIQHIRALECVLDAGATDEDVASLRRVVERSERCEEINLSTSGSDRLDSFLSLEGERLFNRGVENLYLTLTDDAYLPPSQLRRLLEAFPNMLVLSLEGGNFMNEFRLAASDAFPRIESLYCNVRIADLMPGGTGTALPVVPSLQWLQVTVDTEGCDPSSRATAMDLLFGQIAEAFPNLLLLNLSEARGYEAGPFRFNHLDRLDKLMTLEVLCAGASVADEETPMMLARMPALVVVRLRLYSGRAIKYSDKWHQLPPNSLPHVVTLVLSSVPPQLQLDHGFSLRLVAILARAAPKWTMDEGDGYTFIDQRVPEGEAGAAVLREFTMVVSRRLLGHVVYFTIADGFPTFTSWARGIVSLRRFAAPSVRALIIDCPRNPRLTIVEIAMKVMLAVFPNVAQVEVARNMPVSAVVKAVVWRPSQVTRIIVNEGVHAAINEQDVAAVAEAYSILENAGRQPGLLQVPAAMQEAYLAWVERQRAGA